MQTDSNIAAQAAATVAPTAAPPITDGCLLCPGCGREPVTVFTASVDRAVTLYCGAIRTPRLTVSGRVRCQLPRHIVAGAESEAAAVALWNRKALDAEDYLAEADTGVHPLPPAPRLEWYQTRIDGRTTTQASGRFAGVTRG